jgi:hypothetical protein
MKNWLPLLLLLTLGCSSAKKDRDKLNIFLLEWSKAISSGKEMEVRKFYDAQFVFPKVLFELPEGLTWQFDIANVLLSNAENSTDIYVAVPFSLISSDGQNNSTGTVDLTIAKTEMGFLIKGMTQELALKIKAYGLQMEMTRTPSASVVSYDSILSEARAIAVALRKEYDSIVFFTKVDTTTLFYVIKGNWTNPYYGDNQQDAGDYKMGVVTSGNKIIIPVEYDKIYNPHGSFYGMIEVEKNGLRGLYRTDGTLFLPCEYNGIFPVTKDAFAQVRKEDKYGWVDDAGHVSFETSSHANNKLFQSPLENGSVMDWEFTFPGDIEILVNPYTNASEASGTIIYPSYVRDFGITRIANGWVAVASSEYGMGMENSTIKFEKIETLSDKFFGLVALFMESGADARGYQTKRNDLFVVDKEMKIVSNLKGFTEDNGYQDPCGQRPPQYKIIEPGLYESSDGHGNYKYYQANASGSIEQQGTVRKYNFTKFTKIDETYFETCNYINLEYEGMWDAEDNPNLVINHGLSSNDLDLIRNEIFAEYGFRFKSEKWKQYFEAQPWYKPQYDNIDQFLSEKDKYNIKFIQDYQKNHKGLEVQQDSIRYMWAG